MKSVLRVIAIVFGSTLVACSSLGNQAGPAGTGNSFVLPNPVAGLDELDNYRASLTVSFQGTLAGEPVEQQNTYEQNVWRTPHAVFTSSVSQDENRAPLQLLTGTEGEAQYLKEGDLPCFVRWEDQPPTSFRPAAQLWPVGEARSLGQETVNGTPTLHYAIDNATLNLGIELTASGDVWMADPGGYVVRYNLTLEGGEAYFGTDSSGTIQIDYDLTQVNARPEIVYPTGCLPVYTGLPVLPEALELNRQPTMTMYLAQTDLASARNFYEEQMEASGWDLDVTHETEADRIDLLYSQPAEELQAVISLREEIGGIRVVASVFGLPVPVSTGGAAQPLPSAEPIASSSAPVRVMESFNAILVSEGKASVLPSFHLVVQHQAPIWTGSSVGQSHDTLIADVEGSNVHFRDEVISDSGSQTTEEAYLIDGQEYVVENGSVSPGIGMSGLTWAMWPMDPVAILAASLGGATLTGTETLDGRTAEVYSVSGSGLSQASGGMGGGLVLPVTSAEGTVWVDQQTGALLRAVLDYEVDVKDADGNVQGTGSGHLEIRVDQVGQVKVSLPAN